MRAVVTRVHSASVTIDGSVHGAIDQGFLILLGVTHADTPAQVDKLVDKITGLRVFTDENDKMNLSLEQVGGSLLVISQFTLYGNCKHGRRPDFLAAAKPPIAVPLYELFIEKCKAKGFAVETGVFGADMDVASVNNGPVTMILDTDTL
ncbi:D-aminoacyl-tRNA deacylase [Bengtsoniella intestinalis]|uniref:D-aminoacyl-tRNA deacylase n=1 Tax=Bengtsoniella intestinalis TaxID=3073143 RepID=UPI00391FC6E8